VEFLKKAYHQDNDSRKYNLGIEISEYAQGTKTVQAYYFGFMNLWLECNCITFASLPAKALVAIQTLQDKNMRGQFLMKLRPEFETVRGSLMNRKPVPNLGEFCQEVLHEEQHVLSLDTGHKSKAINDGEVAFISREKEKPRSKDTQCYSCQKYGHISRDCKERFCRYCKKGGYILTECRRRPQNRGGKAYHTIVGSAEVSSPPTSASNNSITIESIQVTIQSAL